MQIDLFIILTIIVIIILALTSKDITTALIIIALMANMAFLYREFNGNKQSESMEQVEQPPIISNEEYLEPADGLYGDKQELYDTYVNSYGDSHSTNSPIAINSASERDYSVDNASVDMAMRRFRDKKVADGHTVKDADFYKHHFANELEESERKQWWGNGEW